MSDLPPKSPVRKFHVIPLEVAKNSPLLQILMKDGLFDIEGPRNIVWVHPDGRVSASFDPNTMIYDEGNSSS
jgi:hypothetical protein